MVKGDSWHGLLGVSEKMPLLERYDTAFGKSKVELCFFFSFIIFGGEVV